MNAEEIAKEIVLEVTDEIQQTCPPEWHLQGPLNPHIQALIRVLASWFEKAGV